MMMLFDKHSKGYLKRAPYQKDRVGQQAHKTETSVVCAHHPPITPMPAGFKICSMIINMHVYK